MGVSLPYGCRYGGCISCAAKLLGGRGRSERGRGAERPPTKPMAMCCVCVARPLKSDCTLDVGVESHDKLYRNPFQSPLKTRRVETQTSWPISGTPNGARTHMNHDEDYR